MRKAKRDRSPLARAGFYIYMGKQKGLTVARDRGSLAWTIGLPNGETIPLDCDRAMIAYVVGYQ